MWHLDNGTRRLTTREIAEKIEELTYSAKTPSEAFITIEYWTASLSEIEKLAAAENIRAAIAFLEHSDAA